jgi:multiple sugar transport system substrate-binding protein
VRGRAGRAAHADLVHQPRLRRSGRDREALHGSCRGRYRIETRSCRGESSEQRQQLVRRLAAKDASIDLMSLDPPYIPEFAEAKFLAPVPDEVAQRVSEDVVKVALEGSTWKDKVVAIPFWANTQLLWYKKSVAESAVWT